MAGAPPSKAERSQALDDLIMGTNSSSIVSKRSVERLYYPDEPHYFRYFVSKFQRRAPLINRGYWLRLRAVDVLVRQFLAKTASSSPTLPSPARKVVINLGCGSDVLPWQCHARYPDLCNDALFIDVDYPDLMRKKRAVVMGTPELADLLGDDVSLEKSEEELVLLRSQRYCQVGCDLRELDVLQKALESLIDTSTCSVLFVAEVSVTYMDTMSANDLLQWASSVGQAELCLLEQILPHGHEHPFAVTMLKHFDKLKTPPRSAGRYPTVETQRSRLLNRGWLEVDIWDLWEAWNSDLFLSSAERRALDLVEPFDEWEEFILFARHYFVLHARSFTDDSATAPSPLLPPTPTQQRLKARTVISSTSDNPKRRFGNAMTLANPRGQHFAVHLMGLGNTTRSDTYDVVALGDFDDQPLLPLNGPLPRVCATLTDLGDFGVLLAGGRLSPSNALTDCWLLNKASATWTPTWKLPAPLYRHAAICLRGTSLALVLGGKTGPSEVSANCYLFDPSVGWTRCEVSGSVPTASFGAILCNASQAQDFGPQTFDGLLSGGMNQDGQFVTAQYYWRLSLKGDRPEIYFSRIEASGDQSNELCIFGAQVVEVRGRSFVCGGIGNDVSHLGHSITALDVFGGVCRATGMETTDDNSPAFPFMIGSSAVAKGDSLVILGGGATCFSMGTFWQTHLARVELPVEVIKPLHGGGLPSLRGEMQLAGTVKVVQSQLGYAGSSAAEKATITAVPRVRLTSDRDFEDLLAKGQPFIIEGLDLGACLTKWQPDYVKETVGATKEVVVHECTRDTEKLDFNSKNFSYVTCPFGSVVDKMRRGERLYLRSLSQTKPSESPALLEEDYPEIAGDFSLPPQLRLVRERQFSSVLRMAGRVNMWLHYDVMANVYAQILGSRRMMLFPPTDVSHLSFAPGASSSSLDVFSAVDTPALRNTHPHEALLHTGDVLLLPAMWLHTATAPVDGGMSIAVNVFFRDLDGGYAQGRDVYGNRDLAAYEKGRADAARIVKAFADVPGDVRAFYLRRVADEMVQGGS